MPLTVYTLIQDWDRPQLTRLDGALAYYAFKKGLGGALVG